MVLKAHMGIAALVLALSQGTALAAAVRPIAVVNATRTAIIGLQTRPAGSGAWLTDQLAKTRRTLGLQKAVTISFPANSVCAYDFRLMFEDGHSVVKRAIDTCHQKVVRLTEY